MPDKRKSLTRILLSALAVCPVLLFLLFLFIDFLLPLPDPAAGGDCARVIVDKDGVPLRAFADHRGVWRYPARVEDVSPLYLEALLGYEDRWFYYHPGVNPLALGRAFRQNLTAGRVISGGSTLTMQTARLLDPHARGYLGKIHQMFRALQLEYHYTKTDILNIYLNLAPFGGTLEGVQAAGYAYLGKSVRQLSHGEAALLAVLPQAPSRLRPDRYPDRAEQARNKVLDRLAAQGIWDEQTTNEAKVERVATARLHSQPILAPLLARRLKSRARADAALVTTIDAQLQMNVADYVAGYVDALPPGISAGVLVVENTTLAVRAYVGSADFANAERFGYVDMIRATRSPGSTLKPFLYGMALDQGLIHAKSLLSDAPRDYGDYRPENFSSGFSGPVSVTEALQRSLNVPAIQVIEHLGPAVFAARLTAGGLKPRLPAGAEPNAAIILGGAGVCLEDLVAGYTALARQGMAGEPRYLRAELSEPPRQKRMLSQGAAWIIRQILAENPRPDRYRTLAIARRNLAWKTGTSFGFRDTWAVGVTPTHTIGVWVGRPDGTPVPGHSGAKTAAPLLFAISDALAAPNSYFSGPPESVTAEEICWPLGVRSKDHANPSLCHEKHQTWILNEMVPPTLASLDQREWLINPVTIRLHKKTGLLAPADCTVSETRLRRVALWPKELSPWIAEKYLPGEQIPALDPLCATSTRLHSGSLKITALTDGMVFRSDSITEPPQVSLRALGGRGTHYWFVNGEWTGKEAAHTGIIYNFPGPGRYRLSVLDDDGNSDAVTVVVR